MICNDIEGEIIYTRPLSMTIILWIVLKCIELFLLGLFIGSLWLLGNSMQDAYLRNSPTPADVAGGFWAGLFCMGLMNYWTKVTKRIMYDDSDIDNIY